MSTIDVSFNFIYLIVVNCEYFWKNHNVNLVFPDPGMGEEDISEMKEMLYKGFKAGNEKVKASDGKFACPYCACKDQDYDYVSLLQHAIRVSEGSLSLHQRARHSAMATYLAIDISYQSPEKYSDDEWVPPKPTKRSRTQVTKKVVFSCYAYLIVE